MELLVGLVQTLFFDYPFLYVMNKTVSKVCILSFSDIAWDGRVLREIEAARQLYQVDVIGYGSYHPPEGVRFFSVDPDIPSASVRYPRYLLGRLSPALWEDLYWRRKPYAQAYTILRSEGYHLIHANDWDTLPAASRAASETGARLLYDAHEYTPGQTETLLKKFVQFPYRVYLLRRYHARADETITVSDGLRDLYARNFGWPAQVILNAPGYVEHPYHPVDPGCVRLIHHGGAIAARNIEEIIHAVPLLAPRYRLELMLVGAPDYIGKLKQLAQKLAPDRINFHDPVSPSEVTRRLNRFDAGISMMSACSLNHINALPNKFFEYIMAGLAVISSPLAMLRAVIQEHQVGVVSPGFNAASLADALNLVAPEQIDLYKRNSLTLARRFNAEIEMSKLMSIYERLLSMPGRVG